MARIFITGSADGLGFLTAKELVLQGHQVVVHARNDLRGSQTLEKLPGVENLIIGNLSNISETVEIAQKVNALGIFDAVIHNAGVYEASSNEIFTINTLAPYILTCLINKPNRLIYLSSGLHLQGSFKPSQFKTSKKMTTYSDSKLHVLLLCKAVASKWPMVYANAVNPGWVPTKMGGKGAPDDLQKGYETQVWLATANEHAAKVSGKYFFHQKESTYNSELDDTMLQQEFLDLCKEISGIELN